MRHRDPFPDRALEAMNLSASCAVRVGPAEEIRRAALSFQQGAPLSAKDALHLACACHASHASSFPASPTTSPDAGRAGTGPLGRWPRQRPAFAGNRGGGQVVTSPAWPPRRRAWRAGRRPWYRAPRGSQRSRQFHRYATPGIGRTSLGEVCGVRCRRTRGCRCCRRRACRRRRWCSVGSRWAVACPRP